MDDDRRRRRLCDQLPGAPALRGGDVENAVAVDQGHWTRSAGTLVRDLQGSGGEYLGHRDHAGSVVPTRSVVESRKHLEIRAETWGAPVEAARLLSRLGLRVRSEELGDAALSAPWGEVRARRTTTAEDWASSGLMALTRRPGGPPLACAGRPATVASGAALALELLTALSERAVRVDGPGLLGERAALAGLDGGGGPVSAGGSARILSGSDGHWVLNLARAADIELVPALVQGAAGADHWAKVSAWSRPLPVSQAASRALLLGLPSGVLSSVGPVSSPWRVMRRPAESAAGRRLRVVNLGALWAAPLAASLLGLGGAEVVHVESVDRPDASRWGDPGLYELLHRGHEVLALDFARTEHLERLRRLLTDADVVIEASRPRALEQLGVPATSIMSDGRERTWLQITGHGSQSPERVAFGDDAAAVGGLVAADELGPVFAGDAIADPLTGLLGALAVTGARLEPASALVRVGMSQVAAYCRSSGNIEMTGREPILPPRSR